MVNLTEKAQVKVRETIAAQDDPGSFTGIRLAVVGGGCSGFQYAMRLEEAAQEGDHVVQVDGFSVYVDEQSMLYLDGTEIDFVETPQGAGFKFNNPNVKSTCGCGDSFKA
ncbi:MAG: iron-sulfur cluster assembly accessory protein [Acidobacteriota bacterium]